MHQLITLVLFALALLPTAAAEELAVTTIVLVRHAEKASNATDPKDPPLSAEGQQRALRIAEKLRNENVAAVFASQYQRTQLTAAPTARSHQLPVHVLWMGKRDIKVVSVELKQRIEQNYRGKTVLIVGHSNTVPVFAEVFSGQQIDQIREDEYGRWIVVSLQKNKPSRMESSHY